MNENLILSLQLLLIGMLTVFTVLSLVVLVGRLLITLVNRMSKSPPVLETVPLTNQPKISPKKMAAITGAIQMLTQGRGRVEKIEKNK